MLQQPVHATPSHIHQPHKRAWNSPHTQGCYLQMYTRGNHRTRTQPVHTQTLPSLQTQPLDMRAPYRNPLHTPLHPFNTRYQTDPTAQDTPKPTLTLHPHTPQQYAGSGRTHREPQSPPAAPLPAPARPPLTLPLAALAVSNLAARPLRQWEQGTRAPRPISARRWGRGGGARATGRPRARAHGEGGVAAPDRLPADFARGAAPAALRAGRGRWRRGLGVSARPGGRRGGERAAAGLGRRRGRGMARRERSG